MKIRTSTLIVASAVLIVGLAGGYLIGSGTSPQPTHAAATSKYYVCEVHGHIHDKPGTCPICGTALKPADTMDIEPAPEKSDRKIKFWRSPMDPTFVSKAPGKDSMGMELVPVYEGDPETMTGMVVIESSIVQQMGIRTEHVMKGPLRRRIRTIGNVTYNEESLGTVTAKLDGWVDKLHVDKTGQPVDVGTPLFSIYSKELEAAQSSFLDSLKDPRLTSTSVSEAERTRAKNLLESSRRRLESWDVSPDQIDALAKDMTYRRTFDLRSPFKGVVTHKEAVAGRFFKAGARLFEIADLSTVWIYAKIYEYEQPWVKEGQSASITLSYIPGRTFKGTVEYVYPFLNEKTRDITVRIRAQNEDGQLLPGMFANVVMDCDLGTTALLVPDEAILDTGVRKLVFVQRGPGKFEGREVTLGVRAANDRWEVLDGLKKHEEVVVSGQFLLDAESKVREAIRKFLDADGAAPPAKKHNH